MNPLRTQYELKKRGITQLSIADSLGYSEMYVSRVIRRKKDAFRKSVAAEKIRQAVAAALGKTPESMFPEAYAEGKNSKPEAA